MFGSRSKLLLAVLVFSAVSGCGNTNSPATTSEPLGPPAKCKGATEYTAGLEANGSKGLIKVTIDDSNPAPPGVGKNDWSIDVKDADGNAMAGANVLFSLYMPAHRHYGPVDPIITDAGDGNYDAKDVSFNMDGLWQVTVQATSSDGSVTDSAMFTLCAQ